MDVQNKEPKYEETSWRGSCSRCWELNDRDEDIIHKCKCKYNLGSTPPNPNASNYCRSLMKVSTEGRDKDLCERGEIVPTNMQWAQQKISTPWERKPNKMTLSNHVKAEKVNESPLKRGPKPTLHTFFYDFLECHVLMAQISGTKNASPIISRL